MEKLCRKSDKDYYKQAVRLMRKNGPRWAITNENIGDIINLILRIEDNFDPNKGKLTNYLNKSVRLRIRYLLRKKKKKREEELGHYEPSYYQKDNISYNRLLEKIRPHLYGREFDIFIECIGHGQTYEQAAKIYGITPRRVQQMVNESVRKLQDARI